jgi:short-subunit dehydrogenase
MKPLAVEEVARQGYVGLMKGSRLVVPGWIHKIMSWFARIDILNISTKVTRWLQKERFD